MKKIYILKSTYSNGETEANCVCHTIEKCKNFEKFIKDVGELDGVKYVSSEIEEYEVEDDINTIQYEDQELMIL